MQGTTLISKTAFALSTTESANQVQNTYDYITAGKLFLYAKASAATVLCNFFVAGNQILRNMNIPFTGTAGTLSTSDNLLSETATAGGRVELTFVATTGTPTVDYLLSFDGFPLGGAISRILGRR